MGVTFLLHGRRAVPTPISSIKMAATLSARTALVGQTVSAKKAQAKTTTRAAPVVCKAEDSKASLATRRSAMSAFAASAMAASAKPSLAAYGQGANIFGASSVNRSDFIPYAGEGYAVLIPSKYNPGGERDFKNTVLRYQDNFDAVNDMIVVVNPTNKKSIKDYGSVPAFLTAYSYMLGKSSQTFESSSEGGFKKNSVSAASLLEIGEVEKKGKTYYECHVLTRTADGDEGGRHHLFTGVVSGGNEYVLKMQVGDKRWFKGLDRPTQDVVKSFVVA